MEPPTPEMLLQQGRTAKREHRSEDARRLFQQALEKNMDHGLRAVLFEELAYVQRSLRDLDASREHYLRSCEIYCSLGDPLKTAHTMRHAADILREQQISDKAELFYSEAIEIYRRHKQTPPLDLANSIRGFALLKEELGDRATALRLWHEARDLYHLAGIDAGISECAARIDSLSD
jgi:tetratricopeptide (TPR) repeat protein